MLAAALRRAGRRRVRLLRWEGEATVHDGERRIELGVETEVAPFSWARSRSWLRTQGLAPARTMLIRPDGGWAERDGRWTALPAPRVAHERAQFAIYGLMLLRPLAGRGVTVRPLGARDGLRGLAVAHEKAPPTELWFDSDARLREARNRVPDPEGGAPVDQLFRFSPETVSEDPRWPRRLAIEQNGRLYFDLAFTRFDAGA